MWPEEEGAPSAQCGGSEGLWGPPRRCLCSAVSGSLTVRLLCGLDSSGPHRPTKGRRGVAFAEGLSAEGWAGPGAITFLGRRAGGRCCWNQQDTGALQPRARVEGALPSPCPAALRSPACAQKPEGEVATLRVQATAPAPRSEQGTEGTPAPSGSSASKPRPLIDSNR